jgi:hypothetical protein
MAGLFSQREACSDARARLVPEHGLVRGCGTCLYVFRDEQLCA